MVRLLPLCCGQGATVTVTFRDLLDEVTLCAIRPCCKAAHMVPHQGIVNRDIKLENTLLDKSPMPLLKLCDFGYSKVGRGAGGCRAGFS